MVNIMAWFKANNKKLLLGQLLLEKKLISKEQLARAMAQQKKTGQRLGDIVAEWNLLSREQIAAVLRKQRTLRLIASVATAMFGPLYAHTTVVAAPVAPVVQKAAAVKQQVPTVTLPATTPQIKGMEVVEKMPDSAWSMWDKAQADEDFRFMATDSAFPLPELPSAAEWRASGASFTNKATTPLDTQEKTLLDPKEAALAVVAQHHVRVAHTIKALWGAPECSEYINKLIMNGYDDQGHARMGFNQSAVEAMLALDDLHEKQFPSKSVHTASTNKNAMFTQWGNALAGQVTY